jgi:myo-inositol-1(or 4)-monophosphatase
MLGEEDLGHDHAELEYQWIIDPLDGTTNYVHGFPYYAVSIGLRHSGELIAGVIYDPVRDEMFVAAKDQGASLNRRPIRCSRIATLDQAMLIASLPVATETSDAAVDRFLRVLPHAQTVQRTGSAALNLAYLAAGRLDGFWSSSLKPWDMAAGVLLVSESGGSVTKMNGDPFQLHQADLLATNGTELHNQLRNLLSTC